MAVKYRDLWVWVSLGVLGFFAVRTAVAQLHYLSEIHEIREKKERRRPKSPALNPEDALSDQTLETLAFGPKGGVRDAAIAIVCDRAIVGPAYGLILQQVASPNDDARAQALVGLRFLTDSTAVGKIDFEATFHALITALTYTLDDPDRNTRILGRQASERIALTMLVRLSRFGVPLCLRAGLITRWLAHYPLGPDLQSKQAAVQRLRTYRADDGLLSEMICILYNDAEGRAHLRAAGLIPDDAVSIASSDSSSIRLASHDDYDAPTEADTDDEDVDNIDGSAAGPQVRRPVLPGNAAERRARRRRREAMVLSDGLLPWGRDDVIQTDEPAGARARAEDEQVSRELEELMDRARQEDRRAGRQGCAEKVMADVVRQ
ncbi:MAG: hypothetical protein M1832_001812 [Thelocarpon impressellum]|nr:MAG: hypothetical protein M1832_001812 [Thelocarpon impressellum]